MHAANVLFCRRMGCIRAVASEAIGGDTEEWNLQLIDHHDAATPQFETNVL
jgi:hypothetical protein